ncbi:hypothetical protein PoB_004516400 [Plakobranchus ocellatus]|uniref:Uncharacterized protein n=1 Tax=Plakobranchus ocellatus TaxID=259542 RepID=A0AAV4BK23_9GAST|nr:hypothetical protein PoB_004516400 [Plakobranchus ocellatus]
MVPYCMTSEYLTNYIKNLALKWLQENARADRPVYNHQFPSSSRTSLSADVTNIARGSSSPNVPNTALRSSSLDVPSTALGSSSPNGMIKWWKTNTKLLDLSY